MSASPPDIDYDALVGLFAPGNGVMPPTLAGREPELATMGQFLSKLTSKQAPSQDVVLYGPRGNGKTVLQEAFSRECNDVDGLDVIDLDASQLASKTDLASWLLYNDRELGETINSNKPATKGVNLKALFATWETLSREDRQYYRELYLTQLLLARCADRPLVVTLDEAHTLDIEVGRNLLNASQSVRKKGAPFLLALAGTPNLRSRLGKMDSTFWSRAEKIPIGRLDAVATRKALVEPLESRGISFEPDALNKVIDDSQQYPYFIQLWGRALCVTLARRETPDIDMSIVDEARPAFTTQKNDYYRERHEEFEKHGLLPVARAVAKMFRHAGDTLDGEEMVKQLAKALTVKKKRARQGVATLSHLGFIWKPAGSLRYEPGIPSLMDYVRTKGRDLACDREDRPPPRPAVAPPKP